MVDEAVIALAHDQYSADAKDPKPTAARPSDYLLASWPIKVSSACGFVGLDVTCVKPTSQEAVRASRDTALPHLALAYKRKMDEASRALGTLGVVAKPLVLAASTRACTSS